MTDRRVVPKPDWVTGHKPASVCAAVVDLCATPEGARDRQLVFGEAVTVLGQRAGWAYMQAAKDGYVGFLPDRALGAPLSATHRVTALATHAYNAPDIKSGERMSLSLGSRLAALGETGAFLETAQGFVPYVHLAGHETVADDPVAIARLFLATPYLWGGNSHLGIDCSGLVQAALLACGLACPGDSDQQFEQLGAPIATDAKPRAGDLFFWPGHVAMATGPDMLIHANAHHMAVVEEPIAKAIARIDASGNGPLLGLKRI